MVHAKLFQPLQLGNLKLEHRIVMPPLTRYRADEQHVPLEMVKKYYAQRASTPGTLLIAEGTNVSPRAAGFDNVPGIWNQKQIAAWKEVTDVVHARKCFIFLQLWALGRRAVPENLAREEGGPYPVVSASSIPVKPVEEGGNIPHALSVEEIQIFIGDFATAAKNAMIAGFDGVEIHGANSYLVDQFWQDVCNKRTDEYGGSIENRARFGIELTKAVIEAVGDSQKVAMRLSPWTNFQGVKMKDPVPQFLHIISELKKLDLAYLHLVETIANGADAGGATYQSLTSRRNDAYIELWGSQTPLILAGGFTPEMADEVVGDLYTADNVCIAFGRSFISTPDLPFRIREGLELNQYDRPTFYTAMNSAGFTDYPFSPEYVAVNCAK